MSTKLHLYSVGKCGDGLVLGFVSGRQIFLFTYNYN